jgi:hypothetical protein
MMRPQLRCFMPGRGLTLCAALWTYEAVLCLTPDQQGIGAHHLKENDCSA